VIPTQILVQYAIRDGWMDGWMDEVKRLSMYTVRGMNEDIFASSDRWSAILRIRITELGTCHYAAIKSTTSDPG
jgi:hypothetical protein